MNRKAFLRMSFLGSIVVALFPKVLAKKSEPDFATRITEMQPGNRTPLDEMNEKISMGGIYPEIRKRSKDQFCLEYNISRDDILKWTKDTFQNRVDLDIKPIAYMSYESAMYFKERGFPMDNIVILH